MKCQLDVLMPVDFEDVAALFINRQASHHVPPIEFEVPNNLQDETRCIILVLDMQETQAGIQRHNFLT